MKNVEATTADSTPDARSVNLEEWSAAILRALAESEEPMTLTQLKDRVGEIIDTPVRGPIEGEIDVLRDYDFLGFDAESRRFALTPEGIALSAALKKEERR